MHKHAYVCNSSCVPKGRKVDNLATLSRDQARAVAGTMDGLAAPSRVRILSRLAAGPCSVSELAHDIGMKQPAVSQQLRVLRDLRLVVKERRKKQAIYALRDAHVGVLLKEAVAHTEQLRRS